MTFLLAPSLLPPWLCSRQKPTFPGKSPEIWYHCLSIPMCLGASWRTNSRPLSSSCQCWNPKQWSLLENILKWINNLQRPGAKDYSWYTKDLLKPGNKSWREKFSGKLEHSNSKVLMHTGVFRKLNKMHAQERPGKILKSYH